MGWTGCFPCWLVRKDVEPALFGRNSRAVWSAWKRAGALILSAARCGHSKIRSMVNYLGIEVDDAIEIAERVEV